jgi:hypothetical protein
LSDDLLLRLAMDRFQQDRVVSARPAAPRPRPLCRRATALPAGPRCTRPRIAVQRIVSRSGPP